MSLFSCWYIYRCVCVCVFCASKLLHECSRHLTAVFPHTPWLAPLTAFGNVCLLSLASLHLEHAPGKLPDLCAIRLVVISCASALSSAPCVWFSYLCCVIEKSELWYQPWGPQPLLLSDFQTVIDYLLKRRSVFLSVIHSIMSAWANTVFLCISLLAVVLK